MNKVKLGYWLGHLGLYTFRKYDEHTIDRTKMLQQLRESVGVCVFLYRYIEKYIDV